MQLAEISSELSKSLRRLKFASPVSYVYDPLRYAMAPHAAYLERYGTGRKRVVFLGMNPGPFGMAQTGVPFGEVSMVRDFLGITGKVRRPEREHPKRPISGFDCTRSEVSGARLWGWIRDTHRTPDRFFADHFVANYCPLVFMEESGRNRTPDKLPSSEREALYAACDLALQRTVKLLQPEWVIGVGAFAEKRAQQALSGFGVHIATILHPSPASPKANRGWAEQVNAQLAELGLR
ncbi:MAG: hypothetical protein R3B13_11790 [Polyangiaceae bacterium]